MKNLYLTYALKIIFISGCIDYCIEVKAEKKFDIYYRIENDSINPELITSFLKASYGNDTKWKLRTLSRENKINYNFEKLIKKHYLIGQIFIKNSNETQNMTFLPWVKFKMNIISKNYSSSDLMLKKVILVEGLLEEHLLKNVESEEKNDLISKLKTLVKIGKVEIMKNLCEAIELFDKNSSENVIFLNDIDTVYYFGGRSDVVVEDSGVMGEYFFVGRGRPRFISENLTGDFDWKEHVNPSPDACLFIDSEIRKGKNVKEDFESNLEKKENSLTKKKNPYDLPDAEDEYDEDEGEGGEDDRDDYDEYENENDDESKVLPLKSFTQKINLPSSLVLTLIILF